MKFEYCRQHNSGDTHSMHYPQCIDQRWGEDVKAGAAGKEANKRLCTSNQMGLAKTLLQHYRFCTRYHCIEAQHSTEQHADTNQQRANLSQSTPEHVARACRQV